MAEIRIPDIGDAENVEVIELCVAPGDSVGPDDAILVIESDKASMEVPAGISGTLEELLVGIGDPVEEGQLIARLSDPEQAAGSLAGAHPDAVAGVGEAEPKDAPEVAAVEPASDKSIRQPQAVTGSELVVSVPDIGDAQDVLVIEVAIGPGDRVEEDGLAVVVESDKATMEIPAGATGIVKAVHVEEGDPVVEGTLLFTLESVRAATGPTPGDERDDGATGEPELSKAPKPDRLEARAVHDAEAGADSTAGQSAPARPAAGSGAGRPSPQLAPAKPPGSEIPEKHSPGAKVYAGPATRRLARELGVALAKVNGTGARGRIVKDDVKLYVNQAMTSPSSVTDRGGAGIPPVPTVDFARFGPVETVPLTRVRAAGARNLHASWLNIPHVTQHDEADVTELEEFRQSLKPEAAEREVNLTPLPFIVKACCYALKEFPTFNASLDANAENYVLKRYYNVGFAVDTDQGLVVPVLKNADKQGIWELAAEIAELAAKARKKRLGMDDAQGGTFSISSLGTLGGTGFTPIINAPEVAILGIARLVTKPVWDGSEFQPRKILPLSLSYDHRAINGAEAGRFIAHLASLLNDIRRLSL